MRQEGETGHNYGLILMDYAMPFMTGVETTKEILKMHKEFGFEPPYIVCLTAFEDNNFRQEALNSGMQAFINKPISKR